jgi:hypothetical protein
MGEIMVSETTNIESGESSESTSIYGQNKSPDEVKIKKALAVPSKTFLRDLVEYHRNTEPEIRRPLNFKKVKYLKKAAAPLKDYIERINTNDTPEDDITIGGSAAAWTQVWGARKPKDLDLYTKKMYQLKRDIIAILSRKYNNVSSRAVIIKKDGTKVIQVMVNDRPVVDIKLHIKTGTAITIFDKEIFYDFKSMDPIRIGKIFYQPINELFARKARGINSSYYDKLDRGEPVGDRIQKDVDDFFAISKSLDRSKNRPKKKKSSGLTGLGTETYF